MGQDSVWVKMIDLRDYSGLLSQSIGRLGACAVYAISAANTKLIKIGYSENIRNRVSGLQADCPDELTLDYILWCSDKNVAKKVEEACHKSLAERKFRGEWFAVSLKDAIGVIEANSTRLYPKKEFYTHSEFVLKFAPISKNIAESVERRMDEQKIRSLTGSLGDQILRSRYLQNARI